MRTPRCVSCTLRVPTNHAVVGTRNGILLKKSDIPLYVVTNHAIVGTRNGILLKNTGNHIGLPLRDALL